MEEAFFITYFTVQAVSGRKLCLVGIDQGSRFWPEWPRFDQQLVHKVPYDSMLKLVRPDWLWSWGVALSTSRHQSHTSRSRFLSKHWCHDLCYSVLGAIFTCSGLRSLWSCQPISQFHSLPSLMPLTLITRPTPTLCIHQLISLSLLLLSFCYIIYVLLLFYV